MMTMRHLGLLAFLTLILTTVNAQTYVAKLTGAQEAVPVATRATGDITAVLTGNQLEVSGSFSGLQSNFDASVAGGAHLHFGLIGQSGPIAFNLNATVNVNQTSGTFVGALNTFTLSAPELAALQSHGIYINIHTINNQGGELRGQLVPDGSEVYTINMFGSNEVPSYMTDAHGALLLALDGTTLTVSGSFDELESDFDANVAGGAHLHDGLAGQNGPVEILLDASVDGGNRSGVFTTLDNTFTLTAAQVTLLQNRKLYSNIHTVDAPGGELRGNVTANPNSSWRVHLAGYNEVPVVTTTGHGELVFELSGNTLTAHGSFAELTSEFDVNVAGGSHIHTGMAGQAGGVLDLLTVQLNAGNLSGSYAAAANTWTLSNGAIDTLFNRMMYVNLHTTGHPAGELRGQIVQEGSYFFNAFLSGNFEVPAVLTQAEGFLIGEVLGDRLIVTGSFANLSSAFDVAVAGGSHLHTGFAGENGGILQGLVASLDGNNLGGTFAAADNVYTLDASDKETLRARQAYANLHTANFQGGELRGQMLHEATSYYMANLSGTQEQPAFTSPAVGAIAAEVAGGNITVTGAFASLKSDFDASVAGGAHIHSALAGSNGPVAMLINATVDGSNRSGAFEADMNTMGISAGMVDSIMQRWAYVNIHTTGAPGGELRGQLMPLANSYLYTNINGTHAIQPAMTDGLGAIIVERIGDKITLTGSFAGLGSAVDTSIVGGVHLHSGTAGTSGPVEVVVNSTFDNDMLGGMFVASMNTATITQTQVDALMDEGMYINIHSLNVGSGEIRGQLLTDYNNAPYATSITLPMAGMTVDIDTSETSMFNVQWDMATDTNGSNVAYVWQLATDMEFTNVIFSENVDDAVQFTTTHKAINTLLSQSGIMEGDTANLYHRVVTTDGSMEAMEEALEVALIRSVITGLAEIDNSQFNVYPNPATDQINLSWSGVNLQSLELSDLSGRVMAVKSMTGANDGMMSWSVNDLSSGMYILAAKNRDGEVEKNVRIVVR